VTEQERSHAIYTKHRPSHARTGSQAGVHVHPVVHLPLWRGTFKVSSRTEGKICLHIIHFEVFIHTSVNITL